MDIQALKYNKDAFKQIKLIKKDYDDVKSEQITELQYENPEDCPIAKALKRRFPNVEIFVSVGDATIDDTDFDIHEAYYEKVEQARKKLAAGAKYAIIKV